MKPAVRIVRQCLFVENVICQEAENAFGDIEIGYVGLTLLKMESRDNF